VHEQLLLPQEGAAVIRVVEGDAPVATDDLVVRIGARDPDAASIVANVADPELAHAITSGIAEALRAVADHVSRGEAPVIRVRSRRRVVELGEQLAGAVAVVEVTRKNARHLVAMIDGLRAAGIAGIQIAWDGQHGERHVFAALERGRAAPTAAPVVLAPIAAPQPVAALGILLAHRRQP
jgi:hypothetical protein